MGNILTFMFIIFVAFRIPPKKNSSELKKNAVNGLGFLVICVQFF